MKKFTYLAILISLFSLFMVGCSNAVENEDQYINVQKRIGNENEYERFKEITKVEQAQKVTNMLQDINWGNAKVSMAHPPDYEIIIGYKNPRIKAIPTIYKLWISPNKDTVELVVDIESKYIHLDEKKSGELFKLLVGEELPGLN